jgi:hypothetical protein
MVVDEDALATYPLADIERERGPMPLMECVDCGREHSTEAVACPQCGRPVQTTSAVPPPPVSALVPPPPPPPAAEAAPIAAAPASTAPRGGLEIAGVVALLGGVVGLVGTFLPWAKASAGVFSATVNGIDTDDGKLALVASIAIVLFSLALLRRPVNTVFVVLTVLAGGGAAIVAAVDLSDTSDRVSTANASSDIVHASTGAGLYVLLIGGGIAIVGAVLSLQNRA